MRGRRVVFWRHGRTRWNAESRFQGHSDVELDSEGMAQVGVAAQLLARLRPSAIVSSDLSRAVVTAGALAQRTGLEVVLDERLRETFAGSWEGRTRSEIEDIQSGALAAWAAGSDLRPGGGERRSEVAARMMAAVDDAMVGVPDLGVLVLVTHGGSARAAIGSMLGLPVDHWGIFGVLSNGAWCVLAETGGPASRITDITARACAEFPDVPPPPKWRLIEYNGASLPTVALSDDS